MWLATLVILGLLVLIVTNAVIRSFTGGVIPGAFEIGQVAMPILVFLALPWTFLKRNNYQLDLFYGRFGDSKKRIADLFHSSLYLVVLAIWSLGTLREAVHSVLIHEYVPGAIRVPVYPARIIITIGCLLMLFIVVRELVQRILIIREKRQLGFASGGK